MFSNKIYEQLDGESIGVSLWPVLANIIMKKCEKYIVNNLIKNEKFYEWYVNDTLLEYL